MIKLKNLLQEVRYINFKDKKLQPISDSEVIRVYHGFNKWEDVEKVLRDGLSGKQRAKRIYSYESGNNPKGLFVSVDFDVIKRAGFAHSGVIIEFSTKVSDLEAPVWVGGRSYFIAGEYASSFKDLDEREQQRLINRQKAGESPYDYISKSDRPELADVIFDNPERQALYIGDLDPNMIKNVWYNEALHKERRTNGQWKKMKRKEFLNKLKINLKSYKSFDFYPNDNFTIDIFKSKLKKNNEQEFLDEYLEMITSDITRGEATKLDNYGFWPKQIKQIQKMYDEGELDDYKL